MADDPQVAQSVRRIILEMAPAPVDKISGSMNLVEDLGYNSLALIELGVELEKEFEAEGVFDEISADVATVGDVEDLVLRLLSAETEVF